MENRLKTMKEHVKISNAVVKRLPIYLRYLEDLMKNNVERISSNELSSLIGFTASQIISAVSVSRGTDTISKVSTRRSIRSSDWTGSTEWSS